MCFVCLLYYLHHIARMYFLVCLFFFFKQKTAYELRISDWSSDVCSSDLATGRSRAILPQFSDVPRTTSTASAVCAHAGNCDTGNHSRSFSLSGTVARSEERSVRERGCQFV